MSHERSAYDIADGLDLSSIGNLPLEQRIVIARLLSRVSERSYRRGFQQGADIARDRPKNLPADLHEWRYGTTADLSPWADCNRAETSLDRLHSENRMLQHYGLPHAIDGEPSGIRAWPSKGTL